MKMKRPVQKLALGVVTMAFAIPSFGQEKGFYATGQIGVSQQSSDSEPYGNNIAVDADFPGEFDAGDGTVGGFGIGYRLSDNVRIEGRIGYRVGRFDDRQVGTGARNGEEYILNGELKSTTFTVEGFYDFANSTLFTPYVKAGIGASNNKYSARLGGAGVAMFDPFDGVADGFYDNYADGDSTELSWNIGAGGNFQLSDRISTYGEYQYAVFGDARTGQDSFTDGFQIDNASAHEIVAGVRIRF